MMKEHAATMADKIIEEFNKGAGTLSAADVLHKLPDLVGPFSPLVEGLIAVEYFCSYCGEWLVEDGCVHERGFHNDPDIPDHSQPDRERLVRVEVETVECVECGAHLSRDHFSPAFLKKPYPWCRGCVEAEAEAEAEAAS